MKCAIGGLDDAIVEVLSEYSDEVTQNVKSAVDVVAKEVNKEIKSHVTFKGSGEYVKSFRLKTTFEDHLNKQKTWYVANGNHRLTHLLENGHATPQGGRTRAFPHIIFGQKLAEKRMEELAKEAVENAGR